MSYQLEELDEQAKTELSGRGPGSCSPTTFGFVITFWPIFLTNLIHQFAQAKDIATDLMDDGQINMSHRPQTNDGSTVQHPELTDQQLRMFGYVGRLGRLVKSTARYLAYTSDLGEAFRPIVKPWVVKAAVRRSRDLL